jgi:hypothetical protein
MHVGSHVYLHQERRELEIYKVHKSDVRQSGISKSCNTHPSGDDDEFLRHANVIPDPIALG